MNIFKPNRALTTILVLVFLYTQTSLFAQGEFNSWGYGALKNAPKAKGKTKSKSLSDTLDLPFFDDFSTSHLFPDNNKWADSLAYINNTFADSPPSIGVATLDAINNRGEFYDKAGYANSFSADELSSLPINLNYEGDNSIYLSFYYQAKGRYGDFPEESDSLILEFYSVEDTAWNMVWHKLGFEDITEETRHDKFAREVIPINDSRYLKKGFRFRFRNVASLSSDKEPSKVINADHWHIDYVFLDKGRNPGELEEDVTFVYPLKSFLEDYESMPWKHFLVNPENEYSSLPQDFVCYNTYNLAKHIEVLSYTFIDNSGDEPDYILGDGGHDLEGLSNYTRSHIIRYPFLTNSSDSASFTVQAKFTTDFDDTLSNNQINYTQKFYDYYAYDDGTAEGSYGLSGDGTQNAKLAIQFDIRVEDTLKAVQMYFVRSLNDRSQKYFRLTIWDDDNGEPGSIIYQKESIQPEYENELNKFHTYEINDTVLVLKGRYYIGWVQTTTDMLNLGMDFDRDKSERIFFNIDGSWENTKFEVALMVRPFFGKNLSITLNTPKIEPEVVKSSIKVYPNPVKNELNISIEKPFEYDAIKADIIDYSGRIIYSFDYPGNRPIDISELRSGVYLLRLRDSSMKLNQTHKIIKTE